MHAAKLLHTLLDKSCESIDKRLSSTLFESVEALTRCKQLSIVSIGRSLNRSALVKHNIKRIDRLFGNKSLHKKNIIFYRGISHQVLKNNLNPLIVIDWSGLTPCGAYHFLSASVTVKGRTLTLYDQAYPLDECYKNKTHQVFLKMLKSLLPDDCKPIIVTDAGFRNTWFKLVKHMGWDFVGRVRNTTHYRKEESNIWSPIKELYQKAAYKASYIGEAVLAKCNPLSCHFYLSKQRKKYRVKRNLIGKKVQCSASKRHEKRENEPWLIVSSLSVENVSANDIMLIYKKRMQIEESFRDLKNTRYGLGLRHCRSYQTDRLNVALLVATLAMLALWLFGTAAKLRKLHYTFQTNTIKNRDVLSCMFVGWQVLLRNEIKFKKNEMVLALHSITLATEWRVI
jgi:hypothetical protein